MYSAYQIAKKFIHYYFKAANGKGHGIHSPFIFDFVRNVMNDNRVFYDYERIEKLRTQLQKQKSAIEVTDFGAGSANTKSNFRKIGNIATHTSKPKKFGRLLFRMANYYKPENIIEIGTSLGISTAYLASGNTKAKVFTLEGSEAIAARAQKKFCSS